MAEPALPRVLLVDDDPDLGRLVQHILALAWLRAGASGVDRA